MIHSVEGGRDGMGCFSQGGRNGMRRFVEGGRDGIGIINFTKPFLHFIEDTMI